MARHKLSRRQLAQEDRDGKAEDLASDCSLCKLGKPGCQKQEDSFSCPFCMRTWHASCAQQVALSCEADVAEYGKLAGPLIRSLVEHGIPMPAREPAAPSWWDVLVDETQQQLGLRSRSIIGLSQPPRALNSKSAHAAVRPGMEPLRVVCACCASA